MFHHHTENSPSTGEPPTPPLGAAQNSLTSDSTENTNCFESMSTCEQLRPNPERVVPSLLISETASTLVDIPVERLPSHDSGYERSPNLNQPDSPQFFMDLVFDDDDAADVIIEDDELCSDSETCCGCQSSNSSATMVQTPTSPPPSAFGYFCDICSYSTEQSSSFQPPSSLPIEIPVATMRSTTNPLPSMSFSWQRPPSRSLPIERNRTLRVPGLQTFLSRSHPRTWPNVILSMARISSVDLLGGHRYSPTSSMSSRLRRIDSSFSSSIESFFDAAHMEPLDDDLDNVFQPQTYEMATEEYPEYRRRLNSDVAAQPLPDLILQSSPRRNRSASVNLPPDHAVLRDIGRSLRRISDDFQTRMSGQQATNNGLSPSCQAVRPNFPVFNIFRRD